MSSKVFGKRQTRPSASTRQTSPSANFVTTIQRTTPAPDALRNGAVRPMDASASQSLERATRRGHNFANLPVYYQAKLAIGQPADPYEQEADRVASQVMNQIYAPAAVQSRPGQALQREAISEAKDAPTAPIQMRREAGTDMEASGALAAAINGAKGGGQPLAAHLQRSMGQAMGAEFSRVRVHRDAQADQLNRSLQAKAFTTGQDVFFRQGAYQPESRAGQALIAHELTHVVQQNGGAVWRSPQSQLGRRAQRTVEVAPRNPPLIQRALENTRINNLVTLGPHKGAVEAYAQNLSLAVESARDMIATKYFVHVPPIDGYMQNLVDNFDSGLNKFKDGLAVPRQAGYWSESYATKIAAPTAGGGLNVILQAKRGNSRPDVILQFGGVDIAWLDITSSASEGHIYDKNHDGWFGTAYVTEVTYAPLKVTELNTVSVPDKATKDISGLLAAAKEAYIKQLAWEEKVIEKYGFYFGKLMQDAFAYVKENAVKHDEAGTFSYNQWDALFSPAMPGNKFEKLALAFMQEKAGKLPDARELAAVIMYWGGMIARYENRLAKLGSAFYLPSKEQLGLSWIKDISSADGEPVVREWFPV